MARGRPEVAAALARAIERAASERGVVCARTPIAHGLKVELAQGAARGVIAVYSTGRVVPNPGAKAHFADVLAAAGKNAAPPLAAAHPGGLLVVAYPSLGADESGKGDYFGPLVAAAAVVADAREAELLAEIGVRDSKLLAGPQQAREIAARLRVVLEGRFAETVVEPQDYNRRFDELVGLGQNSHLLLAEAHARAMAAAARGLAPALGLIDKFGSGREIERERRRLGLAFPLRQETGGERYIAVAAASILARDRCLEWFEAAESRLGLRLPRGASDPQILVAARRLYERGGLPELGRHAKLHFRTTLRVTR